MRMVALLLLATCGGASADEQYRVLVPSGDAPRAAVLLVPGCGGFAAVNGINLYEERAGDLQAAGNVVVFVDYLGRFGDCAHMSHARAGNAILEAAEWVHDRFGVDPGRISVIGWSYGGGAVLAALAAMAPGPPALARAVMYYPDCRGEAAWSAAGVSALMLLGADDDVARPAVCDAVVKAAPPTSLRSIVYPNAHHGFDARSRPAPVRYPFGTVGYNADAAKSSWTVVLEFLR
jgi:dienelactone hydrolase